MTNSDRIELLLTRDYHGDEVTRDLCHDLARWARRFHESSGGGAMLLRAAEHAASQSDQLRRAGKVAVLRGELDRRMR